MPEESNFQEEKNVECTLYLFGNITKEKRLSSVGFEVKNSIVSKLKDLPFAHFDRIVSKRLPLQNQQYATLLCVYHQFSWQNQLKINGQL